MYKSKCCVYLRFYSLHTEISIRNEKIMYVEIEISSLWNKVLQHPVVKHLTEILLNYASIFLEYSTHIWQHTFLLDICNIVINKTDQSSSWLLFFFLTISPVNTPWLLLCVYFHSRNIPQLSFWWPEIWKIIADLFFVF